MAERRVVYYSGRVQGVGFRYTARQIARGYHVAGWVKNLDDGRVELVAEGNTEALDGLLSEIEQTLGWAIAGHEVHVERAEQMPAGFSIRY